MIKSLTLKNFRGFEDHTLPLRQFTIIVGHNNAGKSTIVEALHLLAIVTSRYKNLTYKPFPSWLGDAPRRLIGVSPSLRGYDIQFTTLFHRYSAPPAEIQATFEDGASITLYLSGEEKFFAVIKNRRGTIIKSRSEAKQAHLPLVDIMPQVAPLQQREMVLQTDYVKSASSSSLAPLHFRNQLLVFSELFPDFQLAVEETWPGVRIQELITPQMLSDDPLYLHVRNEDFVAEIGAMGHGLQMWLQTMWFLVRSRNSATVILDEPDVYMHADLQRRLVRFIRGRFPQVILTTHSVEIMAEVQPEEILVVDKRMSSSAFTTTLPSVQRLVSRVGSVHNLQLARLWHAHRFLLVEGKDITLLECVHNKLFPETPEGLGTVPHMAIGGWGGWSYAVGSSMLLKNAMSENILTYCILDSDYHTEKEIDDRYEDAAKRSVNLHVWSKKEIENYFLIPGVIQRLIQSRLARRTQAPTEDEIAEQINNLARDLEVDTFDAVATEVAARNRPWSASKVNKESREILQQKKEQPGGLLSIVSGKELFSRISAWIQEEFGVSFGLSSVANEMRFVEIPSEMATVVRAIKLGELLTLRSNNAGAPSRPKT